MGEFRYRLFRKEKQVKSKEGYRALMSKMELKAYA